MADLSDVETALATLVVAILYPAGTGASSVSGKPVRVYRGWPLAGALDVDLASGIANISIFAVPGATRNTTRWPPVVHTPKAQPTLTVQVSGHSATFGGVGGVSQVSGVLVDNEPFVHRGEIGDTPALVAAVLAEHIRAKRACWLSGTTVSVPGARKMLGRVCADADMVTEWGRQEQSFRVSAWCPDPATRDLICRTLGSAFSGRSFLSLPDGTDGRLRYRATTSFDEAQAAQMYRRDLVFDVEYATTVADAAPSMLFGDLHVAETDIYG